MIPLYKPFMPSELPLLNEILHSGAISYGKWGKIFEQKLADYIGIQNILTTNTYNSAMQLCIATLGLKHGDEIIASPMSCLASNQPFAFAGLKVIWADINPKTGTMCPDSLRKTITKNTKAIFHNHFAGYVGDIDSVNSIAHEFGLLVIDDAIEAFGSKYKHKRLGNCGSDATVYSFQTVRLPNTIDGGAVSFKSKEHFDLAYLIRDYGIDRNKFRDSMNEINPLCDISMPALGATLNEINSYIGCVQMDRIDTLLLKQKNNALFWTQWIKENLQDVEIVQQYKNTNPNYWVYGLLVPDKKKYLKYFRENGYYVSGVHLSNTNYSVFGQRTPLKGVVEFNSKFIALPSGWWINLEFINSNK